MKTIIAGSRTIFDYAVVERAVTDSQFQITEVVSGCAQGVDVLGMKYAIQWNLPIKRMSAEWVRYGRRAGILRNQDMAEYADALIAVWDGRSPGTANMIEEAKKRNLKVFVALPCPSSKTS